MKSDKAKRIGENIQVCYAQPKNLKRMVTQKTEKRQPDDDPGASNVDGAGFPTLF